MIGNFRYGISNTNTTRNKVFINIGHVYARRYLDFLYYTYGSKQIRKIEKEGFLVLNKRARAAKMGNLHTSTKNHVQ